MHCLFDVYVTMTTGNTSFKLFFYVSFIRVRRASPKLSQHQVNKEQKTTDGGPANETCNEISYHELGEINKSETYETCR